jgi:NAD-dependent SIR2 family protein deacetylase
MRKKPYTEIGIRRLRCFRCRVKRPTQQWQICADGNQYRPICNDCDFELNKLVLDFFGFEDVDEMMSKYGDKLDKEEHGNS